MYLRNFVQERCKIISIGSIVQRAIDKVNTMLDTWDTDRRLLSHFRSQSLVQSTS